MVIDRYGLHRHEVTMKHGSYLSYSILWYKCISSLSSLSLSGITSFIFCLELPNKASESIVCRRDGATWKKKYGAFYSTKTWQRKRQTTDQKSYVQYIISEKGENKGNPLSQWIFWCTIFLQKDIQLYKLEEKHNMYFDHVYFED